MAEFKSGTWYPIESAPRDGTKVLATWKGTWPDMPHIEACECGENGDWFYSYDGDGLHEPPTHWTPLPKPPQ